MYSYSALVHNALTLPCSSECCFCPETPVALPPASTGLWGGGNPGDMADSSIFSFVKVQETSVRLIAKYLHLCVAMMVLPAQCSASIASIFYQTHSLQFTPSPFSIGSPTMGFPCIRTKPSTHSCVFCSLELHIMSPVPHTCGAL